MPVLTVGDEFPSYELTAVIPGKLASVAAERPEDFFTTVSSNVKPGTWRVVFFWPKDFTFVCPTEISSFGQLHQEFVDRDCEIVGVSVDSEYTHYAWRRSHDALQELPFPMASDTRRDLVAAAGVLGPDGVADRATFIVDPNNIVQFSMVTSGAVGRNTEEVLRQLDALQSDELCACNWEKGAATIDALKEMTT